VEISTAKVPAKNNIYYVWNKVKDDGLTTDYRLRIRAIDGNTPAEVLDEVSGLIIADCEWQSVEEESNSVNRLSIKNVQPNPADVNTQILYTNSLKAGNLLLSVYDTKGEIVMTKELTSVIGENEVSIDTGSLASGNYMIVISAEGQSAAYNLQVIR
jgi:hypothetical protein